MKCLGLLRAQSVSPGGFLGKQNYVFFGIGVMEKASCWVHLASFFGFSAQKILLCLFDLLALLGTALAVFFVRAAFGGLDPVLYHWVVPMLLLGPVFGAGLGLYQTVSLAPHRELKALFQLTSLLYAIILAVLFLSKTGDAYSRIVIMGSWAATLFSMPLMRSLCRHLYARRRWWGKPLVIFDHCSEGRELWHYLKRHPERGLNPVSICNLPDEPEAMRHLFAAVSARQPKAMALLLQKVGKAQETDVIAEASRYFSSTLVVPAFGGNFRVHWLTPRDLGNAVGLLVRQNLRDKRRLFVKRCLDIGLCLLGSAFLLPFGAVLALIIKLDSPGPVFYRQRRIGQGGKEIRIFKFRTMVNNADKVLKNMLSHDAALRAEWCCDRKLKCDPRITRAGRLLRKLSLDELPQLINVVAGDMSLVGPRPIVRAEVEKYGPVFDEYCMVRPGITGLWQVSGRNNTTYEQRVSFDQYYINNWSVWMDLWILGKTVTVVILGHGAY